MAEADELFMKNLFYKIKYFFGTIYRGLIGMYHNAFDKALEIKKDIEWFSIGGSVEGRQIRCYKIGDGRNKVLIVAGIHGNEVGTVKLAQHILNWFWKNKEQFQLLTLYVIPVLNPDGYEIAVNNHDYIHRGRAGRFNVNGVDLNRNFPTQKFEKKSVWPRGKDYQEKEEVYCGEFGGSESETKSLLNLIQEQNIKNLIMLHNLGSDAIVNEGDAVATNWAEIYKKYTKFKIRHFAELSGSANEWARENNINYMAIEGSSRWGSDWGKQSKAIIQVLKTINNS